MKKDFQNIFTILIFISISILFTSCKNTEEYELETGSTESIFKGGTECIQPVNPIGANLEGLSFQETQNPETPPENWEKAAELTDAYSVYSFTVWDESALWISYSGYDNEPNNKLVRYNLETNEKTFYSLDPSLYLPGYPFFSTDGTLWFVNNWGNEVTPFFSRYNPKTDQFEFVLDNEGIMQPPNELGSIPVEDYRGKLLFTIRDQNSDFEILYRFDPNTLKIEEINFPIIKYGPGFVLSTDKKNIIIVDNEEGEIKQYDIKSREINTFHTLPQRDSDEAVFDLSEYIKHSGYIYYDGSDRLWLSNNGWIDFSDPDYSEFYELLLPPVFLEFFTYEPRYAETATNGMLESSDGYIWYSTYNAGVIRLDVRNELTSWNWCMVTNDFSKVIEDQDHTLWMIVFNEIYKLDISE